MNTALYFQYGKNIKGNIFYNGVHGFNAWGGWQFSCHYWKSDGTRLYLRIHNGDWISQYSVAIPWNANTATYISQSLNLTQQGESNPTGFCLSTDGSRMFVTGTTSNTILSYTLSTPWNVNTAVFTSFIPLTYSQNGMVMSYNGNYMFVKNGSTQVISRYVLSTPWDITTGVVDQTFAGISPWNIHFIEDGSRMFQFNGTTVRKLSLSVPWDLTTVYKVELKNLAPVILQGNSDSIYISPDGKKMSIASYFYTSYLFDLKKPFKINGDLFVTPSPEAATFIAAVGITNQTQINAISMLVENLKVYGLWTKMQAIYPILGGTAAAHKFNLKNPVDTNAAFRLTFTNVTHTASGITGASGFAETYFNPSLLSNPDSWHMSNYCITNTANAFGIVDMGVQEIAASIFATLFQRFTTANTAYFDSPSIGAGSPDRMSVANTDSRGFYSGSRISSTSANISKNGNNILSNAVARTSSFPNDTIYLLALHNGSSYFSDRTYNFFSIGTGLTITEENTLYLIVQQFQTTLGRQV